MISAIYYLVMNMAPPLKAPAGIIIRIIYVTVRNRTDIGAADMYMIMILNGYIVSLFCLSISRSGCISLVEIRFITGN